MSNLPVLCLLIWLASGALFLLGLMFPRLALFWRKAEKRNRKQVVVIYGCLLLVSGIGFKVSMNLASDEVNTFVEYSKSHK